MKNKFPKLRAALLRGAQSIPVLIGVVVISFVLTRALPGDPAAYFAGAAADENSINEIFTFCVSTPLLSLLTLIWSL